MKTRFYFIIALIVASFAVWSCDDDSSNNNTNNTNNINNDAGTDADADTDGDIDDDADATETPLCSAPDRSFWNYDLTVMPPRDVEIPAKCHGESDHAYVYVADDAWENGTVTQEMVDKILHTWEVGTDKYADRGIYPTDTSIFGNPPDVDGDPHIIIFVTPLGSFNGTAFDGYFKADNEVSGSTSNMTEMIYIDCENHEPDSDYLLGVLAHEFQHMLQWNIDPYEEDWLDETFSQAAMVETGYWSDLGSANAYLSAATATSPLPVADVRQYNYGAGFIFASYAIDRFGTEFFHDISSNVSEKGIASINSALITYAQDANYDFFDLVMDWAVASLINDSSVGDGRYVYDTLGTDVVSPSPSMFQLGTSKQTSLAVAGYYYAGLDNVTSGQDVNITIDTDNPSNLKTKIVFYAGSDISVEEIDLTSGSTVFTPSSDGFLVLVIERVAGNGNVTVTFN